ncbi:MAG: flagellar filament capping protein FliD, partial [Dysosmobacter sp.]|nr:flagellar filament capping protein FliD [Dysosmobacter sp.]
VSTSYTGDELLEKVVKAEVDEMGNITFSDPKSNNVYISSADESVRENLLGGVKELSSETGKQMKFINAKGIGDNLVDNSKTMSQYLEGGSLTITLDGVQKSVKLPSREDIIANLNKDYKYYDALKEKIEKGEELNSPESRQMMDDAFVAALQKGIDSTFGEGKLKVEDAANDKTGGKGLQLEFSATQKGSTFSVYSDKGKALGMGESGTLTSYLNTNKTLGELLGEDGFKGLESEAVRKVKKDENGNVMKDDDGNTIYETDDDGNPVYETDSKGDILYSFKMNDGKEIGQFSKNTTLQTVMNTINSNSDSGVKVNYSKTTNEFVFTAKDSGKNSKIETSGLSEKLFGTVSKDAVDAEGKKLYSEGKDAIFSVSINGTELKDIERSSNTVEFDGLSINLKGVFGYAAKKDADGNDLLDENGQVVYDLNKPVNTEPITFETSSDADKRVDAVKAMSDDYNARVTEIKNAYSTLPAQRSNGAYYEPLTDEDQEGMSETAINNWQEKAKQGILFADNDLRSLYNRLTSAISVTGENGAALRAAGITVNYTNGLSTLDFNETEFRAALDSDPDKVRDAFTASTESGAKSNGLMQALKQPLEQYGKTTGGKGILVEKAGSPLAPSTMYNN